MNSGAISTTSSAILPCGKTWSSGACVVGGLARSTFDHIAANLVAMQGAREVLYGDPVDDVWDVSVLVVTPTGRGAFFLPNSTSL